MAVDASRIAGARRRGLGSPPTDGAPGLEDGEGASLADGPDAGQASGPPVAVVGEKSRQVDGSSNGLPVSPPTPKRRVPAPQEEARIPFTTRIAVSTKERLEEACYTLRTKHQAFIDEAIRIHLEKSGF